ncbi:hypothetical protein ACLOJK_041265 [Asimina triloba]
MGLSMDAGGLLIGIARRCQQWFLDLTATTTSASLTASRSLGWMLAMWLGWRFSQWWSKSREIQPNLMKNKASGLDLIRSSRFEGGGSGFVTRFQIWLALCRFAGSEEEKANSMQICRI